MPSNHPHESMLRDAYARFAQGDLAGFLAHCTDDITFRVPGHTPVSGLFSREQFLSSFISTVMDITKGTFRETVTDVVANDTRGVVVAQHEFDRDGKRRHYNTLHLYRILHGKLASFEEFPEDLHAFEEAWGRR